MGQWYCFRCKEQMIEQNVLLSYLEITRGIDGLRCPKCKATYLTEETTVEVVSKAEEGIEAKFG